MRLYLGDDNGQLKVVNCTSSATEWNIDILKPNSNLKSCRGKAIQKIAVYSHDRISVAHEDGSLSLHIFNNDESFSLLKDWSISRFRQPERFVGLAFTNEGHTMSCTSNGHLSLAQWTADSSDNFSLNNTSIPKRLCDWKLSSDSRHFIYGGEEVEVSLWDTERAFDPTRNIRKPDTSTQSRKRKSIGSDLLDGEVWRAKNVSNDSLNLRQPVHNTALTFLSLSDNPSSPSHHIISGTRIGSLRRYDTRVARKPAADWKNIGRSGGIRTIEKGNTEYEIYISDCGSDLIALDLRVGRVLYTYGGLASTISSIASTSSMKAPFLASASLDRYVRLHKTQKPGEVLAKVWTKTIPTCVAWDGRLPEAVVDEEENADAIWDGITDVVEDEDESTESDVENQISHKKRKNA